MPNILLMPNHFLKKLTWCKAYTQTLRKQEPVLQNE